MNRSTTLVSVLAGVLLLGAIVAFSVSAISSAAPQGPRALADQTACRGFDLDLAFSDAQPTIDLVRSKVDDADATGFPSDHYRAHMNFGRAKESLRAFAEGTAASAQTPGISDDVFDAMVGVIEASSELRDHLDLDGGRMSIYDVDHLATDLTVAVSDLRSVCAD